MICAWKCSRQAVGYDLPAICGLTSTCRGGFECQAFFSVLQFRSPGKHEKQIIKFLFPSHLPFPGLSKECQESDKLKAADYCSYTAAASEKSQHQK